ncbi:MAG: helicase [Myxococcales bacterium]|nr:helicase [Myxococcales bacterium]MCB9531005.1 helicase [Myxococcales bacterium]MCB9532925.1 helicase [Myxococcales bacterium]
MNLEPGQFVRVRSRKYLVEGVTPPPDPRDSRLVRLSCVEDDALGEKLEVLWDCEIDARVLDGANWQAIASRGFDQPRLFSAYLNTLRWNCVTATRSNLFQAPYRAGIEVKAFQLEPLRKALAMPRVNLFIADDVGLGKTIEAGLILRELLMRQKVRRVVISCPPSVVRQWKDEMEQRFGLSFEIYDRDFVTAKRQERGYQVNPWTTHSRFIISHALLRNEAYTAPLRDWLGEFQGGALLILDEAHNAAPASGSRYAVDSKLTKVVRDLSGRFEHKLFLSATPHNGHSNSFSALLEMLDPQKFCRGVPVHHMSRDQVMVRRLKHDLREIGEEFPAREIVRVDIDGLPDDAPELVLSRLLQRYRKAREARLADAPRGQRTSAMLVVTSLQKRLLSSVDAFARTLAIHEKSMARQAAEWAKDAADRPRAGRGGATPDSAEWARELDQTSLPLLLDPPDADDERADLDEAEVEAEEDAQMAAATRASMGSGDDPARIHAELEILAEMSRVAGHARYQLDARTRHLVEWIRSNCCPDLGKPGARWNERRVLVFTEYTDTKRYLEEQLREAIRGSDQDAARITTFHGGIGEERREQIKAAFNADPAEHPLRILIATDAAREGVNLQNHCADLFHADVPWNPSRMEQRNGRIDRKLQRAKTVRCHYFVVHQRAEDRVLDVLVGKSKTIHAELGSLAPVVARRVQERLEAGIDHDQILPLQGDLERIDTAVRESAEGRVVQEDLEEVRERKAALVGQVERLEQMLKTSRDWIGLDDRHFRDALSAALEILGAETITPVDADEAARDPSTARWTIPHLHETMGTDHTWAHTLDALRAPIKKGQKPWEWRREAPIRPVVFRDPGTLDGEVVHLHLEHRVVQRLLGRFLAQGFLHDELTRACVLRTDDPVPRVVTLGRLSLYGDGAARLHDELVAVAADWTDPASRGRSALRPVGENAKSEVLALLDASLASPRLSGVPDGVRDRLKQHAPRDVSELHPHLERRAAAVAERSEKELARRGEQEARAMREILQNQKERIERENARAIEESKQLTLGFSDAETRQFRANQRHWEQRLRALDGEIETEPARVRDNYVVRGSRLEPVGLVYLWPVSG